MKIKIGFISNSSSASFIIKWGAKDNRKMTLKQALSIMKNNFMFENRIMTRKIITRNTKDIGRGEFVTEFFTGMMNVGDDFGEEAKSFLINIMTSDDFEIYDYRVDRDEG